MLEMFWELRQQQRIADAHTVARESSERAVATEYTVEHLKQTVDKLSLICMAMWSLLQEVTDLKEEHLIERVKELDLLDGKQDGKLDRGVEQCPKCRRPMSSKHGRCLYCGHVKVPDSAFDTL